MDAYLVGLGALVGLFTLLWVVSLPLRDASIVDSFWGPAFLVASAAYVLRSGASPRAVLILILVALWALRLAIHIFTRNRGHGEDRRYVAMREQAGAAFWWVSLFRVFLLQAVLAWLISAPLAAAIASAAPLGLADALGVLLWGAGLAIETAADAQLRAFRADPAARGTVLRTGVWAWSRHPNYFGEALLWWGYFVLALAAGAGWTIFAPLLMTFLLVRVSGVALLERDLAQRKPGYADYMREVPSFIPRPPRSATRVGR